MRFGVFAACRRRSGGGVLTITTAPTIAGDMVVGQRLFAVRGTYSAPPDSYVNEWFLDGVLLDETSDSLLIIDTYATHTITFGEIAHKAGYTSAPLNMSA